MTPFRRIMIQILVILTLFIGMLAVLGRENLADENVQLPITFGKAVARGWDMLVAPRNAEPQPGLALEPTTDLIQCAYQWATQPLPEVSSMLQEQVINAGMDNISIIAEAFGEDCINPENGKVIRFIARQTDLRIRIKVNQISDKEKIGNQLAEMLEVITSLPPEILPGPQSGMIEAVFTSSEGELILWFPRMDGEAALKEGKKGADLVSALQN